MFPTARGRTGCAGCSDECAGDGVKGHDSAVETMWSLLHTDLFAEGGD